MKLPFARRGLTLGRQCVQFDLSAGLKDPAGGDVIVTQVSQVTLTDFTGIYGMLQKQFIFYGPGNLTLAPLYIVVNEFFQLYFGTRLSNTIESLPVLLDRVPMRFGHCSASR